MSPVGFYDLRDAGAGAVPVVSTAFRPVDRAELARNPFRVFTSMLVADDPRYFDADLTAGCERFLAERVLFGPSCWRSPTAPPRSGGCPTRGADGSLALGDRGVRAVARPGRPGLVHASSSDLGGRGGHRRGGVARTSTTSRRACSTSTSCRRRMRARGIAMIDEIQGPPRLGRPDVLLRQTSFRALAEPRRSARPTAA